MTTEKIIISDVDGTLVDREGFVEPVFMAIKQAAPQQIYLCTQMHALNVEALFDPAQLLARLELIKAVIKKMPENVQTIPVITPWDPFLGEQLGAFYQQFFLAIKGGYFLSDEHFAAYKRLEIADTFYAMVMNFFRVFIQYQNGELLQPAAQEEMLRKCHAGLLKIGKIAGVEWGLFSSQESLDDIRQKIALLQKNKTIEKEWMLYLTLSADFLELLQAAPNFEEMLKAFSALLQNQSQLVALLRPIAFLWQMVKNLQLKVAYPQKSLMYLYALLKIQIALKPGDAVEIDIYDDLPDVCREIRTVLAALRSIGQLATTLHVRIYQVITDAEVLQGERCSIRLMSQLPD
jgi:hypothetical protein